jgi:hypothetical protein
VTPPQDPTVQGGVQTGQNDDPYADLVAKKGQKPVAAAPAPAEADPYADLVTAPPAPVRMDPVVVMAEPPAPPVPSVPIPSMAEASNIESERIRTAMTSAPAPIVPPKPKLTRESFNAMMDAASANDMTHRLGRVAADKTRNPLTRGAAGAAGFVAGAVQHPIDTANQLAEMVPEALDVIQRYGDRQGVETAARLEGKDPKALPKDETAPTARDAMKAAAVIGLTALGPAAEGALGSAMAPAIGSGPAAAVTRGVGGAALGAALSPNGDEGVGAIAGGFLGGASAVVHGERALARRTPGAPPIDDPNRQIGDRPKPTTAEVRVAEPPPAPEGPDFTVEDAPYADLTGEAKPAEKPVETPAEQPKGKTLRKTKAPEPAPAPAPVADEAAPAQAEAPADTKADTKPTQAPAAPERTSIKEAQTGAPLRTTLMRGQGAAESPYNPLGAQVPILGAGRYGTTERSYAEHFGPNVTEHEASLNNPLVIDSDQQWRELTSAAGWQYANPSTANADQTKADIDRLRRHIESLGHDGVVVRIPKFGKNQVDERTGKTLDRVFGADQVIEFAPAPEKLTKPSIMEKAPPGGFTEADKVPEIPGLPERRARRIRARELATRSLDDVQSWSDEEFAAHEKEVAAAFEDLSSELGDRNPKRRLGETKKLRALRDQLEQHEVGVIKESVRRQRARGESGTDPAVAKVRSDIDKVTRETAPTMGGFKGVAHTMQYPSGRWGFVGGVHPHLGYINEDGSPPTEKQIATIRHSGAGFTNPRIKSRTFATKEEALAAADALGQKVEGHEPSAPAAEEKAPAETKPDKAFIVPKRREDGSVGFVAEQPAKPVAPGEVPKARATRSARGSRTARRRASRTSTRTPAGDRSRHATHRGACAACAASGGRSCARHAGDGAGQAPDALRRARAPEEARAARARRAGFIGNDETADACRSPEGARHAGDPRAAREGRRDAGSDGHGGRSAVRSRAGRQAGRDGEGAGHRAPRVPLRHRAPGLRQDVRAHRSDRRRDGRREGRRRRPEAGEPLL